VRPCGVPAKHRRGLIDAPNLRATPKFAQVLIGVGEASLQLLTLVGVAETSRNLHARALDDLVLSRIGFGDPAEWKTVPATAAHRPVPRQTSSRQRLRHRMVEETNQYVCLHPILFLTSHRANLELILGNLNSLSALAGWLWCFQSVAAYKRRSLLRNR
jgi:hypothetical protein